jgi:TolA-binding protein
MHKRWNWAKLLVSGAALAVCLAVGASAQSVETSSTTSAEEQNETFRDTLVRMRIKREEEEHRKLIGKAERIKTLAQEVAQAVVSNRLPRETDKQLKEIEKNARQIRADAGGGEDEPLENPPRTLPDTLKQLEEASESLNKKLGKTSRHIVSLTAAAGATEIIQLVKLLRGFLK